MSEAENALWPEYVLVAGSPPPELSEGFCGSCRSPLEPFIGSDVSGETAGLIIVGRCTNVAECGQVWLLA